jgi:hypothetical protein
VKGMKVMKIVKDMKKGTCQMVGVAEAIGA